MIKQSIMPWVRWAAGRLRYKFAQLKANFPLNRQPQQAHTVFIIGCGRSGTTVLGEVLEQHPQTYYFFEPWHLWAAVDSRLDTTTLYTTNGLNAIIGADSFSKEAQARFNRLFHHSLGLDDKILIEKTPHNAWRIEYLEKLVPNARFVHIVRDGIDVTDSINKLALENCYRIAPASQFNPWWGFNDSKWKAIIQSCEAAGYNSAELERLVTHRQKGALEWLLSLKEIDKQRKQLGDRLIEVKYVDLVDRPIDVLSKIASFMESDCNNAWLKSAMQIIKPNSLKRTELDPLVLPPEICEEFNSYQKKYGFTRMSILES